MSLVRVSGALVVGALVGGCGPTIVSGSPQGVWVQEPMVSFGSAETKADSYCAKVGKRAVYKGRLAQTRGVPGESSPGNFMPIFAFDCE